MRKGYFHTREQWSALLIPLSEELGQLKMTYISDDVIQFKFKFLFFHIIKYIEYSVFVMSCTLISRIFNCSYTIQ